MSAAEPPNPSDEERVRGEVVVERELTTSHRRLRFTVPRQHAPPCSPGWRLDRYLHALLPTISRTLIQRWVSAGAASVDGVAGSPDQRLRAGNRVVLTAPLPEIEEGAPAAAALTVLYRDRWLWVVNKPPGQLAHQAGRTMSGTLINQVQDALAAAGTDPRSARLVNRIDRDTSGIVLVSLDATAHTRMAKAMEAGVLRKEYLAIVHGVPEPRRGSWRERIGPSASASIARCVRDDGQECHTEYEVLEEALVGGTAYARLRLRLHTGRQHQIRVHAACHGHPLVGDWVYGQACAELPGQALHAALLELPHPMLARPLVIEAPFHAALGALWSRLRDGIAPTACALSDQQRSKLAIAEDPGVRRPSWLSAEDFRRLAAEAGEP